MKPPMLLGESIPLNQERGRQSSKTPQGVGSEARATDPPGSQN